MTRGKMLGGVATALLLSAPAQAFESGFYAGLTVGQADHDLNLVFEPGPGDLTLESSLDTEDTSFGAFGGYQFGRWFALEGAFNQLGTSSLRYRYVYEEATDVLESSAASEIESYALSISALVTIPIGDRFAMSLRAGAAYADVDVDARVDFRFNGVADPTENSSDSDSSFSPVYGAGVEYIPTRRFSLRLEWQRFDDVGGGFDNFDGFDIDVVSVSALARF